MIRFGNKLSRSRSGVWFPQDHSTGPRPSPLQILISSFSPLSFVSPSNEQYEPVFPPLSPRHGAPRTAFTELKRFEFRLWVIVFESICTVSVWADVELPVDDNSHCLLLCVFTVTLFAAFHLKMASVNMSTSMCHVVVTCS